MHIFSHVIVNISAERMFIYMGSAYNCGTQNATLVKNEKQKTQPIAEADFIKGNSQVLLMFSILPVERGTFPQRFHKGEFPSFINVFNSSRGEGYFPPKIS